MYDMKQVIVNYNLLAGQIKQELDIQFDSGRIKGTEYADVFNKLMTQAMGYAFDSPVKEQQVLQAIEQTELLTAQKADQKYVTQHIRPLEKQKIVCETDLCESQIRLTDAQASDQEYVTQTIRPIEMQIKQEELGIAQTKNEIEQQNLLIRQEELEIKRTELEIAREKLELAKQDVAYKEAQTAFTIRQTEGFDDNKKQKMLEIQMNAWAMMFSSGLLDQVPSVINRCYVDSLYNQMSQEVGISPSGNCETPTRSSSTNLTPCEKEALKKMRAKRNASKDTTSK